MQKVYEHKDVIELLVKNLRMHLSCRENLPITQKENMKKMPSKSVVRKLIVKFEKVLCRLQGLCTDEEMRNYDRNLHVKEDDEDEDEE